MSDSTDWLLNEYDQAFEDFSSESLLEKEIDDLEERYDQMQFIARGGMKEIYSVHDCLTDRTVAMARLINSTDSGARERFIREARINSILQHPNIMPIYDLGRDRSGEPFFTMKLLEGQTLHQALREFHNSTYFANISELGILLEKFAAVCEAVAYAHSKGVVHLDLKPDNIWLGEFGQVIVGDWGLARVMAEKCDERYLDSPICALSGATSFGLVKGTPGYLSPEQAQKISNADARSDIYSLGAILYHILTGKPPIDGRNSQEIIEKTLRGEWQLPSRRFAGKYIPEGVEAVVVRALAVDPSARYENASDLAMEIRRHLTGYATEAEHAGFARQLMLLFQRNRKICVTIAVALAFVVTITTAFVWRLNKAMEIARDNALIAQKTATRLQEEKAQRYKLKTEAAKKLYQEGRASFLAEKNSIARSLFKEAVNFDSKNYKAKFELAGLCLNSLDVGKSLELLQKIPAGTVEKDSVKLTEILQEFHHEFAGKKISVDDWITLNIKIDKQGFHYFGRCLRTKILEKELELQQRIDYVIALIKAVNDNYDEVNCKVELRGENIALDLSNNSKLFWLPGVWSLPIVDLNLSNTSVNFINRLDRMAQLKKLNLSGSRCPVHEDLFKLTLEELHWPVSAKPSLKKIKALSSLKKLYLPESFRKAKWIKEIPSTIEVCFE